MTVEWVKLADRWPEFRPDDSHEILMSDGHSVWIAEYYLWEIFWAYGLVGKAQEEDKVVPVWWAPLDINLPTEGT